VYKPECMYTSSLMRMKMRKIFISIEREDKNELLLNKYIFVRFYCLKILKCENY